MATNINNVLDALHTKLGTYLIDTTLINKGYDYRTAPDEYWRTYMIAYAGGMPTTNVTGGQTSHMNLAIVMFAKHDGTQTALRTAERDLNAAETAVYNMIEAEKNQTYWHKIICPAPSTRPGAPRDMPHVRIAVIPLTIILK